MYYAEIWSCGGEQLLSCLLHVLAYRALRLRRMGHYEQSLLSIRPYLNFLSIDALFFQATNKLSDFFSCSFSK